MITPAEVRHDLITIGACPLGKVVGRQMRTQHLDGSARLAVGFGDIGHVNRHKVHRDAADHRHGLLGNVYDAAVDQCAEIAVGIPETYGGDARRSRRSPSTTVANGL